MTFEQFEYKIPQWAVCALINGDYSGLSDEDEENLNAFTDSLPIGGHWSISDDEPYFSWDNDVDCLGNNVYDMVYMVPTEVQMTLDL